MGQAPVLLSIALVASALVSCFVSGWALTLRRSMPIIPFVLLTIGMALYSGGYAVEINERNIEGVLAAIKLEYLGLAFIPVLLFVVATQLVLERPITWPQLLVLLVIPAVTLALVLTMPAHDLFYKDPRMSVDGPFPSLQFERGPWYLVNYTYQTTLLVISTLLLILYSVRVRKRSRWVALMVTSAALLPIVSSLAYFAGLVPYGIDPVPVVLGLTALVLAAALLGLRLFDLIPAAREIALDSVSESLLVIDSLGLVRDFNPSATRLPGLVNLSAGSAIPDDSPIGHHLRELLAQPGSTVEFSDAGPSGRAHYSATSYRVSDPRGGLTGTAIMVRDVTVDRQLRDELARQAAIDELTGALTRRAIMQEGASLLGKTRTKGQSLAVLMLDLDEFKELNDEAGHASGDRALGVAGEVMRQSVRAGDLLGRIGGDEFAILMPGADLPTAELVAERLHQRFRGVRPDGWTKPLRASIGVVAGKPAATDTLADYLEAADRALYQAKRSGGDRTVLAD